MALASDSGCGSYGDASGPLSATRSETCINGSPQPIRRRTLAALLLIPSQGRATRPLPLRWPKGNGRRRRVGKIGSLLGACLDNSGLWWRRLLESDSVCL